MTRSAQRNAFLARLDDELGTDKDSLVVFRLDLDRFARIRRTFGYYERSQSNWTLTVRGNLKHNEIFPVIRFLYNAQNWGYGVAAWGGGQPSASPSTEIARELFPSRESFFCS